MPTHAFRRQREVNLCEFGLALSTERVPGQPETTQRNLLEVSHSVTHYTKAYGTEYFNINKA